MSGSNPTNQILPDNINYKKITLNILFRHLENHFDPNRFSVRPKIAIVTEQDSAEIAFNQIQFIQTKLAVLEGINHLYVAVRV